VDVIPVLDIIVRPPKSEWIIQIVTLEDLVRKKLRNKEMIFKTQYLKDYILGNEGSGEFEDDDGNKITVISDEHESSSRWTETREVIFKFNNTFYGFGYDCGLTESQFQPPFEYDGDEIECYEVIPVPVTEIVYMTREQAEKQKK